MWYLQDLMDSCIRQLVFRAIIIFLILFVGCDTPYSNRFLGQGVAVEDIQDNLADYVEPGKCVTDGFDWVCREVHTHHVILEVEREVVREVKVPEPYPVFRRELYIVQVEPNQTVETPLGIISTDAEGEGVDAPRYVTVTSVKIDEQGAVTPIAPSVPRQPETQPEPEPPKVEPEVQFPTPKPPVETEPEQPTPEPPVETPVVEPEPVSEPPVYTPPPKPRGEYVVYSERVNGSMQSGVIHSDYVVIQNGTITFTGQDGEIDPGDTVREYVKVETGLTYAEASKRAPEILGE